MKKLTVALVVLTLLTACQSKQAGTPSDASDSEIRMAEMMMNDAEGFLPQSDIASLPEAKPTQTIVVSDGDRIEINPTLVRKEINGKEFAMYGYNGQIPGPMIKAPQGSTITIDVTNDIDMETTIHWHGLRLDNKSDGVPDVTQEGAIQPGDTFRYTVSFPDEGMYWYHPHVREDIQQDLGLYGNLFVNSSDKNSYNQVNKEEVIVLDDLMLDDNDELIPYGKDDATFPLMGRFGNLMLVNGNTDYDISVDQGSVVRFYITNVANTRTFKVNFDGAKMKRVGSDVGRYEKEEWVDAITIAPAERYIVEVLFDKAGTFAFKHESPLATYNLGTINVSDSAASPSLSDAFNALHANDDVIADIDDYRRYFEKEVDKTLRLDIEMSGNMDNAMMAEHPDDGIEWEDSMAQMNAMMTGDDVSWKLIDEDSKKENMDIDWNFEVGDVKKIRVINDEDSAHPMQHPIHFHGQRFLVLSIDGKKNTNLTWRDTVLIPTGSEVDLLFDMTNPGEWMFHCHIAEHLTNGMMGMFTVTES